MLEIIEKLSKHIALCRCVRCKSDYVTHFYDARKSKIGDQCTTCKTKPIISQQDFIDAFDYSPITGEIRHRWATANKHKGDLATYSHSEGYLSVLVSKKELLAHRVIWFIQTGEWPIQIDHIDHDRTNNRWLNLRNVQSRINQLNTSKKRNNTSGVNGVRKLPSGRFWAYIMVNRKQIGLGSFATLEEASAARKLADAQYGFHVNHGS